MAPPKTPGGGVQRRPEEFQDLMKYEVVSEPKDLLPHTVKVILLEDIEGLFFYISLKLIIMLFLGVGHQFDIMEFDHNFARDNLLLPRKAVYASPFDLKYYMKLKEVSISHQVIMAIYTS